MLVNFATERSVGSFSTLKEPQEIPGRNNPVSVSTKRVCKNTKFRERGKKKSGSLKTKQKISQAIKRICS